MIIEYDQTGRITHMISDPVPQHMASFLEREGRRFLDLPPTPAEPEPQFDAAGNPVLDDAGAQIRESNGTVSAQCDLLLDYVLDGDLCRRPACPASVNVIGRSILLADVPDGTSVTATIGTVAVPVPADETEIEVDEGGPITVILTPPWPYLEGKHALEIE